MLINGSGGSGSSGSCSSGSGTAAVVVEGLVADQRKRRMCDRQDARLTGPRLT